jgi:hypothetical protein
MASSRRTGTNENISTFGGAGQGRDYTSLATWEAATDNDLVTATQSEVLECYDDVASFNEALDLNGATTNSSYFRIIRPAAGQGHDGTPNNGVFFDISGIGGDAWRIEEENASIQDVILKATINSAVGRSVLDIQMGPANFAGVIVFDSDNIGAGTLIAAFEIQEDDVVCVNCLALDNNGDGFNFDQGNAGTCYNCTSIGNADGFLEDDGPLLLKNCLADNNTTDFNGGTGGNNNASGDATAPGTSARINQTFTFVNSGADDYHLTGSDGGARNFGADLSADGVFAFDDDIDFETRPGESVWDIGFDEYIPVPWPGGADIDGVLNANLADVNGVLIANIGDINGV